MSIITMVACVVLAIADADAATVNLRWDRPLYRADCTPLPASEIGKYEIEWQHQASGKTGVKFPKSTLTGYALYVPYMGRYSFRIRAYDTAGRASEWDPKIYADVLDDGKIVALQAAPTINKCAPITLPVCPYLCRAI